MTPSYRHRFLSVPTGMRLELNWHRPALSFRSRVRSLFSAAPPRHTPAEVDPDAFREAFRTLAHDPDSSAAAFSALGYQVTAAVHDTAR